MSEKKSDLIKTHRIRIVVFWLSALLIAGVLYAFFVTAAGISLPCVFHEITGFWCPGCGASRMFLKIFKADFAGAFYENRFLFSTIVFLIAAVGFRLYQYIKKEPFRKTVWFIVFIILYAAAFLAFGILRNLSTFSFLAPLK